MLPESAQHFDGYNLNKEKPLAELIANVALGIYGANNAKQIAELKAAGGSYRIAQYWNGNGCEHGGMANQPLPLVLNPAYKFKSNNIVGIEGGNELLRLLTDKRDWFVQYPNGDIVESMGRWAGNIYFNLLNPECLEYWQQQLTKHMLPDARAVFLDNLSAEGLTAMSPEPIFTATYGAGDSATFLDAQVNFLKITRNHLAASGKKLYANVSRSHKNPDYFKAMCEHLDGVMIEHAFSEQTLASDLDLIHWLTSRGKEVFIVCGVEPHETEAIERYTACYKLVECPLTYIRYSNDDAYSKWWIPQYSRDTEQLLTPSEFVTKQAEISTRRFHGGYAFVNAKTREYGIEIQKSLPTTPKPWIAPIAYKSSEARDRETVQVYAKPAQGGSLTYAVQSVPAHEFRIYDSGMITHGYSASGDYLITVMVFETDGGMSEVSFVWTIRTPYDVKVIPLDNSGIEIEASKGGKLLARVQLVE